jgi:AraC-like DNA-binding protein
MNIAMTRLKGPDAPTTAEAANRLGYDSEAAFSRAFKKLVGVPPGSVRRTAGVEAK